MHAAALLLEKHIKHNEGRLAPANASWGIWGLKVSSRGGFYFCQIHMSKWTEVLSESESFAQSHMAT